MRSLILTGFMGTGKTTVGALLARRFGLQFVDLDSEVERRAGRSIAEIFATEGEESFRSLEREVFASAVAGENRIVATGGGTLLAAESRALIGPDQAVVCLTCTRGELARRLSTDGTRPLLREGVEEIDRLLERRMPVYASFEQVDTTARSPEDVAEDIGRRLALREAACLEFTTQTSSSLVFGQGQLRRAGDVLGEHDLAGDVLAVADQTVAALPAVQDLMASLSEVCDSFSLAVIPAGEAAKNHRTLSGLYERALERHLDRQSVVVGVGGGVIGDLAGMLAATYLRGLRLVLFPTTLVAQVDAAIGGKVGVDVGRAKNMVGAFHPASLIVIDPEALGSLPPEALADGLAEVVKIALVRSRPLLDSLEGLADPADVLRHSHIVRQAALEKFAVVRSDPYERGIRALLNFGHTIGHALEAASGYTLSHGRAVSIGMVAESRMAEARGWSGPDVLPALTGLLERFGLPTEPPPLDPEDVLGYLMQDKKRRGGEIRFAVPVELGRGAVFGVPAAEAREVVAGMMEARPGGVGQDLRAKAVGGQPQGTAPTRVGGRREGMG